MHMYSYIQEQVDRERGKNEELTNFLTSIAAMPSGYDEIDGGEASTLNVNTVGNGNGNNGENADDNNDNAAIRDIQLLEQGLQLAYESKV